MYSFGELQAVSKLQKWFLEYEISLRSAIVLHLANRNSFGHTKHGQNVCGHPSNAKKLRPRKRPVRISSNSLPRVEYHKQNAMTLSCVLTLAPPYHPSQMYHAGLPYVRNTENIRTI